MYKSIYYRFCIHIYIYMYICVRIYIDVQKYIFISSQGICRDMAMSVWQRKNIKDVNELMFQVSTPLEAGFEGGG